MGRPPIIDISGDRFGMLMALNIVQEKGKKAVWRCLCDCGATHFVTGHVLRSGRTRSCGCGKAQHVSDAKTRHGESKKRSPEYNSWRAIADRCTNKDNFAYKDYGARGIKICKRWSSFENFLKDMGRKPSPRHSIDRRNNNGNYTPRNCRWATAKEQANNRRKARS